MKLKWYGHSCFGMTFADGTTLVTDPFDEHGVFAGGGGARAGLQHGRGGDGVGSHGENLGLRQPGAQPLHQRAADAAALTVNDENFHRVPYFSTV